MEKQIKELYDKGLNDTEIAKKINKSNGFVARWRYKNNLPSNYKKNKLKKSDHQKRLKLYNKGMSDREIGRKLNKSHSTIYRWRKKYNLVANEKKKKTNKEEISKTEMKNKRRLKLYNKGLNDREIAEKTGVNSSSIYKWRKRNNLPANYDRNLYEDLSQSKKNEIKKLYNKGLTDTEISKKIDLGLALVRKWRKKRELESNYQSKQLNKKEKEKIKILYDKGFNDVQIAEKINRSRLTVVRWREKRGLESNYYFDEKDYKAVKKLRKLGYSDKEIANKLNFSVGTIYNHLD